MKLIYKLLLISGIKCIYPAAMAVAQNSYTLDECVEKALENNIKVINAVNELSMAQEDRKEAFTKYFPNINAAAAGFTSDKGLAQMNITPDFGMTMMKNGVTAGITASLPLFTGGQILNGNKLAQVGVEVKRLQKNISEDEVILTVQKYFWQCVLLEEKLKTINAVENQLDNIIKDVKVSLDAGLITRNDLLQAELKQNETQSGKITVQENLNFSLNMLAQYIGCAGDSISIVSPVETIKHTSPDSLFCDHKEALMNTDEYALLEQSIKANELEYKIAIGKNMPNIAVGGGYAYHNFLEKDHPFWVGFATVNIPITGWWGGSHSIKKHKLQLDNARNNKLNQEQMLVLRMQNVWNELNNAYQQMNLALLSIDKAEENLRMNNDFYSAGTSTMSDLLQAQTIYQQSRDNYVESCIQYELKKREYIRVTGKNNIRIK